MAKTRKDDRGRSLRKGEMQRSSDKRYAYSYTDPLGRRKYIYANDLVTLREKEKQLMTLAASMWNRVGIRAEVELLHEDDFFSRRKSGSLACYTATWAADFDDPDNFFSTFFGSRENAVFRSLCYQNEQAMERVRKARAMTDRDARTREYQVLEEIIVRQDAAWIPLFSRLHYYVAGERVSAFEVSWNGWVSPRYSDIAIGGI